MKLVTRVKRLEGLLQQRKRRLMLSDSEGEDATTTEQEFDLAALHTLANATLGDDSSATAAGPDAETTMPVHSTSTTCRRLRNQFTSYVSAHGEDATTTEQEFDLAALHTLANATLGDDSSATAAGPDAETTMPVHSTSTTCRRLRNQFTSYVSAHVSETIPAGVRVPAVASTIL
nr:hypothetical protein [Tanacetum cinerariifolium]